MRFFAVVFLCFVFNSLFSQINIAPGKYWIYLKDKYHSPYSVYEPQKYLSERAIERRYRQGIPIDISDIPVSEVYLDSIRQFGITVLYASKWFNAVAVEAEYQQLETLMKNCSFTVNTIFPVKPSPLPDSNQQNQFPDKKRKLRNENNYFDYGSADKQIDLLNGQVIHNEGFRGENMHIAVIDAGFLLANQMTAFDTLRKHHGILGTYDFVKRQSVQYNTSSHGTKVLSLLAGYLPEVYVGTAPNAKYWLLRSENASSEYLIEECNWAVAAEYADSAGADIITSSLGYSQFDNPLQNHKYNDLDGKTTIVTQAANMAFSKGMLVINSAGNSGNKAWQYVTAPADGFGVIAVGATDSEGSYVSFSSRGPTADDRIKPDVAAQGYRTFVCATDNTVERGNGTSFSAPQIAGLSACLWQKFPDYTNIQIRDLIIRSSSQFYNPDYQTGYGIPDFGFAIYYSKIENYEKKSHYATVYPIPFNDILYIKLNKNKTQKINIHIANINGQIVYRKSFAYISGQILQLDDISHLTKGMYFMNITSDNASFSTKIIKH